MASSSAPLLNRDGQGKKANAISTKGGHTVIYNVPASFYFLFQLIVVLFHFSLLLSFGKLPLSFLAFIIGQNVGQEAAGNRLNLMGWNVCMVDQFLFLAQVLPPFLCIQFSRCKSIAFFPFFPRRMPLLDFPSNIRRDFFYKRPKLFVLLVEPCCLQLLTDAVLVGDLFFQPRILLRQIVNRDLVFLHLSQMCFQLGKEPVQQYKGFLFLLPGVLIMMISDMTCSMAFCCLIKMTDCLNSHVGCASSW